jgi:hypothetical protein
MIFTVHAETLSQLGEAIASRCDGVRFGMEFCEWKIPSLEALRKAHAEVTDAGKAFTYVVPILTNEGMERIREHLVYLGDYEGVEVVMGDIGVLNLLQKYDGLTFRLGRPRVYIPGRNPWDQITRMPNPSFFARRKVEKIFYQTNLNYWRALEYYRSLGVKGAEVDWIPKSFPHYKKIVKNGFRLAVHTYAVPVAVTMRCHTARFLGEEEPALCTKPCLNRAFNIHQKELDKSFVLHGNVVFRLVESTRDDLRGLKGTGVEEIVLPMGPLSRLRTTEDLDEAVTTLSRGV